MMQENSLCGELSFSLSQSAQNYLQEILQHRSDQPHKPGFVPILSYSGGSRIENEGKVLSDYNGPNFLVGSQKLEALGPGKYYHLLGFPIWIDDSDNLLLKGRTLTVVEVGHPEPMELLVIENAPENYLEIVSRENSCCGLDCKSEFKKGN